MANRATPAIQQETLSPPWLLASFDSNWNSPITALNDASMGYVNGVPIDSGSANNVIVTLPFGIPSSYNPGMTVAFYPAASNTGSSVITVNPLTSVSILNQFGQSLSANDLVGTQSQSGVMNGTQLVSGLTSTTGLVPGQLVSGANIAAGTTIAVITGPTSIALSQNASGSGTNSITFTAVIATVIFDGTHFILLSPAGSNLQTSCVAVSLGVVSTNQNVACAGAKSVAVLLQPSASLTLTLSNLSLGVPVTIWVQPSATLTFKITATQPGGTTYTAVIWTSS